MACPSRAVLKRPKVYIYGVPDSAVSRRRTGLLEGRKKSSPDRLKNFDLKALSAGNGAARVKNHAHEYMT
jgi:hypothetical protein